MWHQNRRAKWFPFTTITGEDITSRAPSSFLELGAADTFTALRTSPDLASTAEVNGNPLDEQQQQLAKNFAKRRSMNMARLAG